MSGVPLRLRSAFLSLSLSLSLFLSLSLSLQSLLSPLSLSLVEPVAKVLCANSIERWSRIVRGQGYFKFTKPGPDTIFTLELAISDINKVSKPLLDLISPLRV